METITNIYHPKLAFGHLSDDTFNNPEFCVVIIQNSVSLRNFGAADDIVRKYNYADVAGHRHPCPVLQYFARVEDRSREGSVHINNPPIYTDGPVIATLITQYGIGRAIEENVIAKKMIKNCVDLSVISHLEDDTVENRIIYFNKCLFNLAKQITKPECSYIKKVILPVGIGRRGVDDVWLTKYMPIIYAFANDVGTTGKEVVLVVNKSYLNHLEKKYEAVNNLASESFEKFKGLRVLSNHELSLDMTIVYGEDEEGDDIPDSLSHYILS